MRGNYPKEMLEHFGPDLPRFTPQEQALLKGSADFVGVNTYTSRFVSAGSADNMPWVESLTNATGAPLGADSDVPWLKVTPGAVGGVLKWLTRRYGRVELQVGRWWHGCLPGMASCHKHTCAAADRVRP
jgi:beta-glucosidase